MLRGDYKHNEGSWVLTPFDAAGTRTRAIYKIWAEPNVSLPNFVVRRAQEGALPDLMKKLRSSVGSR